MKKVVISLLRILPVWTILDWIVEYLDGITKKTEAKWDDMVVDMLEAVIEVMRDNEDVIFNGQESKKDVKI